MAHSESWRQAPLDGHENIGAKHGMIVVPGGGFALPKYGFDSKRFFQFGKYRYQQEYQHKRWMPADKLFFELNA
jgi:hypothetical protein